jgi:hypothetical protein
MKEIPMRPTFATAAILAAAVSTCGAVEGNVNLLMGGKRLDKTEWEPQEKQAEMGIQADVQPPLWPFSLVVNFYGSNNVRKEDTPLGEETRTASTSEMQIGVREIWHTPLLARPYIGGGVTLARSDLKSKIGNTTVEDSDSGAGVWAELGVYWTVYGCLNLGPAIGVSSAKTKIGNQELNAGGTRFSVIVGYHW